jgi:diguanylate cyclase (GGDEF)-like protein
VPDATFPPIQVPGEGQLYARFHTTLGNIVLKLEEEGAPNTVKNFVGLATGTQEWKDPSTGELKKGTPLYDGTVFHRVIPDFMIQGGCPLGQGTGNPGYRFKDEFNPKLRHSGPGILSMANSGRARVVGALEGRHTEPRVATTDVVEILEMLATHAATAIESARLHEVIEQRSQKDPLTRLLNRRRLEEDLDAECKRCARYGRPLAFVMLDVDNFKAFNDAHGHPQADTVLQEVADVLTGCVRATDTAYRYGGEEFCILLRETGSEDAMIFAERVRQRIQQRFASGISTGVTASFGVAGFSSDTSKPRTLVEAADVAMYESKHAGRNRVMLSVPPPS